MSPVATRITGSSASVTIEVFSGSPVPATTTWWSMVDPLLDIWIEQPIDYVAEGRALVSLPTVNDEGDADDYLSPLD